MRSSVPKRVNRRLQTGDSRASRGDVTRNLPRPSPRRIDDQRLLVGEPLGNMRPPFPSKRNSGGCRSWASRTSSHACVAVGVRPPHPHRQILRGEGQLVPIEHYSSDRRSAPAKPSSSRARPQLPISVSFDRDPSARRRFRSAGVPSPTACQQAGDEYRLS